MYIYTLDISANLIICINMYVFMYVCQQDLKFMYVCMYVCMPTRP